MNTSKSVGPYSIPTNILKLSCSVLSKPLVKLINFSFSEGTFPNLLKFANVIPVFKKADNIKEYVTVSDQKSDNALVDFGVP